jgi:hypothetical protein
MLSFRLKKRQKRSNLRTKHFNRYYLVERAGNVLLVILDKLELTTKILLVVKK